MTSRAWLVALALAIPVARGPSVARAEVFGASFRSTTWGVEMTVPRGWELSDQSAYPGIVARAYEHKGKARMTLAAQKLAPRFYDPLLGTGLYEYWRSAVSMNTKALPDWGDHRAEGIVKMQTVESDGVFLGPGATMALAFTWIEERDMKRALGSCLRNYRSYPDNIINNLVLARVYIYTREYDSALRILNEILADDPQNQRSHYYLSTVYLRKGEVDRAQTEIDKYMSFPLENDMKAQGMHRKGDICMKRQQYKEAENYYKEAVKLADYGPSKQKLTRIEKMKKEGKI